MGSRRPNDGLKIERQVERMQPQKAIGCEAVTPVTYADALGASNEQSYASLCDSETRFAPQPRLLHNPNFISRDASENFLSLSDAEALKPEHALSSSRLN